MEEGTTGAPEASAGPALEIPDWGSDALDALIAEGDYAPEGNDETTEGGPAAENAAQEPEAETDEPTEPVTEGDDQTTDTEDEDPRAADLPDDLKEILKTVPRSKRGAFIKHFEGKAATRHEEAQKIEDRNREEAASREATAREIREKQGTFIGEVESQDENGRPLPTYKEMERLLKVEDGDDILDDKWGLSPAEAKKQLRVWDQRKAMLDGSVDHFRDEAWVETGKLIATSVAKNGLPIEQVFRGVQNAGDVVTNLVNHFKAENERALAKQRTDYESRLKAATSNGTATAAKTVARTHPTAETGGRGEATSGGRIYTTSEIDGMSSKEIAAIEDDLDRAYDEGRIREG